MIGINVTFIFHSFFSCLVKSRYLSFFSLSFDFTQRSAGIAKSTILQVLFFLLIIMKFCRLAEIRCSVRMSKFKRSLCMSFFRADIGLWIFYLFVWSNWNFLYNSQWITVPYQSCLVLYSFCANLLHLIIIWLIVSSLSPNNLHFAVLLHLIYSYFDMIGP